MSRANDGGAQYAFNHANSLGLLIGQCERAEGVRLVLWVYEDRRSVPGDWAQVGTDQEGER